MCAPAIERIVGALPPTDALSTNYQPEGYSSADVLDVDADSDVPVIHFCRAISTPECNSSDYRLPAQSGVRPTVSAIDP